MRPSAVHVEPAIWCAALERATAAWPREFVAILGGTSRGDVAFVAAVEPLAAASTGDAFAVDAVTFARAEAALRANGHAWLGFLHSHPDGAAAPSTRDRRELWQDCVQIVVATARGRDAWANAFRIGDGGVVPLPLHAAPAALGAPR